MVLKVIVTTMSLLWNHQFKHQAGIFLILIFQVLYWLSGLTCTDENFITKSGAQRVAASEGVALIAPDTSPS